MGATRSEAIAFGVSQDFLAFIARAVVDARFQITRQTSGVSEITPSYWTHNNMRYFVSSITPDSARFRAVPRSRTSAIARIETDTLTTTSSVIAGVHTIQVPEETPFAPVLGPREGGEPDYYCHEIVMGQVESLERHDPQAAAIIRQAE